MKNLLSNWKTSSAGLLTIGIAVIHLWFTKAASEADWTLALTQILTGVGLMAAGDAQPQKQEEPRQNT